MKTDFRLLITVILMGMMMALLSNAFGQIADDATYYRIITRNNLFRPLGWTPPEKKLQWYLIGTKIDEDGTGWAYMSRNPEGLITSVVRVGIDYAGSRVKSIERYKVEMENGDVYTMPRVGFLQTSKSSHNTRRSNKRTSGVTQGDQSSERTTNSTSRRTQGASRGQRSTASPAQRARWQEQIEKFQKASPEERLDMIDQFRNRGGRRGRRQGGN